MKKALAGCLTALMTVVLCVTALASDIVAQQYTDVPGTPTQDAVVSIEADGVTVQTARPVTLTMSELQSQYKFVVDENNRPVNYFEETVRTRIMELAAAQGTAAELLHISEFFNSAFTGCASATADAEVSLQLTATYTAGQPVVSLLGVPDESGVIVWHALDSSVTGNHIVTFIVPLELLATLEGKDVIISVMTIRYATIGSAEQVPAGFEVITPSMSISDINNVVDLITSGGAADEFQIMLAEETTPMQEARDELYQVAGSGQPVATYFDEATRNTASLLQGDDLDSLVAYEIAAVTAVNYVDTYGDAAAVFTFATPYTEDMSGVTMAGYYDEEQGTMVWTALRTEFTEGGVSVTFTQQLIPILEERGVMIVVLSEPIS